MLLPFNIDETILKRALTLLTKEGLLIRAHYSVPTPTTSRTVLYGVGKQFDSLCERIQKDEDFLLYHCRRKTS